MTYTNPTSGLVDWWPTKGANTIAASFAHVAVKPGSSNDVVGVATLTDQFTAANGTMSDVRTVRPDLLQQQRRFGVDERVHAAPPRHPRRLRAESTRRAVYVATSAGRVFRSSASGASGWAEASTAANRPAAGNITSIAVDPGQPRTSST